MMTVQRPLFDMENIIPELNGDGPGAALNHPNASHVAADKADATKDAVKAAVLILVEEYGVLTGRELNDLYTSQWRSRGWGQAAPDSPRKRAGELFRQGRLNILNESDWRSGRGAPAEYTLLGVAR